MQASRASFATACRRATAVELRSTDTRQYLLRGTTRHSTVHDTAKTISYKPNAHSPAAQWQCDASRESEADPPAVRGDMGISTHTHRSRTSYAYSCTASDTQLTGATGGSSTHLQTPTPHEHIVRPRGRGCTCPCTCARLLAARVDATEQQLYISCCKSGSLACSVHGHAHARCRGPPLVRPLRVSHLPLCASRCRRPWLRRFPPSSTEPPRLAHPSSLIAPPQLAPSPNRDPP